MLSRKQLRRLIEGVITERRLDGQIDLDKILSGGGDLPPAIPPERGGGGRGPSPCETDLDGRFDRSYNTVLDAFSAWLASSGLDEFTYIERQLSADLSGRMRGAIEGHRHMLDYLSDELLYEIAMSLCEGRLSVSDLPRVFSAPAPFL